MKKWWHEHCQKLQATCAAEKQRRMKKQRLLTEIREEALEWVHHNHAVVQLASVCILIDSIFYEHVYKEKMSHFHHQIKQCLYSTLQVEVVCMTNLWSAYCFVSMYCIHDQSMLTINRCEWCSVCITGHFLQCAAAVNSSVSVPQCWSCLSQLYVFVCCV